MIENFMITSRNVQGMASPSENTQPIDREDDFVNVKSITVWL